MTIDHATRPAGRKSSRKPRYGAYGRVSRVAGRDEKLRSPELMTKLMHGFAKGEGIELDEVVIELDLSGSKTYQSAELERLIQRVESGELAGIVVPKLDRLSRLKARQRIELVERIGNERLLSATESNDVSTPEGRFVREIFFALARMEWEQKADGFVNAKAAAIAAGVAVTKRAAFGLAFDARHRYIAGAAADVKLLRELFTMRAGGASWNAIAERFEQATGRETAPQTMSEMLANRVYLGELRHGEHVNLKAHAAIVPVELFEAAADETARRTKAHGWSGRRATLLAGIAECASCGAGLTRSTSNGGASVVYRCPTPSRKCGARASIGLAVLEAYVIDEVLDWAGESADELVAVEVELGAVGDRIVAEHKLEQARGELVRWAQDVAAALENDVAYAAGLQAREELVATRERELEACDEASDVEVARGTIRTALAGDELELDERRELLATVLDRVVVRKTPRAGAAVAARAKLLFTGAASAPLENAAQLDEQEPARAR